MLYALRMRAVLLLLVASAVLAGDKPGPKVAITAPAGDVCTNQPALEVTVAFEALGNVQDVDLLRDGMVVGTITNQPSAKSGSHVFTAALDALAEGTYVFQARAYQGDRKGNLFGASDFLRVTIDRAPPQIAGLVPEDGAFLKDPRPLIAATYSDVGCGIDADLVRLSLDGEEVQAQASATGISFTPGQDLSAGLHHVELSVVDHAGNLATAEASWTVDLTRPTIAVAEPVDGTTTTTSTPLVRVTYGDLLSGIDLASLVVLLDGADVTPSFTKGPAEATFTPQMADALSDGQHILAARIRDRAGNEQATQSIFSVQTAQVDTMPPAVSIVFPRRTFFGDPSAFEGTSWRFVVDARDPGPSASGVEKVQFLVDGAVVAEDTSAPYETTVSFPDGISGQTRTLTAVARDNAGNQATSDPTIVRFISRPASGAISFRASGGPAAVQAGDHFPGPITIEAIDAQGNVDPSYTGTIYFFTSDPRSYLRFSPYAQFTAADHGVIHVDFEQLLFGTPPLLTSGQQAIFMADASNPARDQGVISVQVHAGPPALLSLSSASTNQVFNDGEVPANPVEAAVTDAFGNEIPGVQVQLQVFEEGVLTSTLTEETHSPAVFSLPRITLGTTRYRFSVSTPSLPSLPAVDVKRFIDTTAKIEGLPELLSAGQTVTLTFSVLDRDGVPVPDAEMILSSPTEATHFEGTPPPFKGPETRSAPSGVVMKAGYFVSANLFQSIQMQVPGGPTVSATAYVQPDQPLISEVEDFGGLDIFLALIADYGVGFYDGRSGQGVPVVVRDRFGNEIPFSAFRVDLTVDGHTYTNILQGNYPVSFVGSPFAFHGPTTATVTVTLLSTGQQLTATRQVGESTLQVQGPITVGTPGQQITLPTYRDEGFRVIAQGPPGYAITETTATLYQTTEGGPFYLRPVNIVGTPSVSTAGPGGVTEVFVSGNSMRIHQQVPGDYFSDPPSHFASPLTISNLTVQTFPHAQRFKTTFVFIQTFGGGGSMANLVEPGAGFSSGPEVSSILEGMSLGDNLEASGTPVSGQYASARQVFAVAFGNAQSMGPELMGHVTSTTRGGSAVQGELPSDTDVRLYRVYDSLYVSLPVRAVDVSDGMPLIGIAPGVSPTFQTVAAEPGGSLSLQCSLGSASLPILDFDATVEVTPDGGDPMPPGESGPRPLPCSIFKDTTPTIRIKPQLDGFTASIFSVFSNAVNWRLTNTTTGNVIRVFTRITDERTGRALFAQAGSGGGEVVLRFGPTTSNGTPLDVAAMTLKLAGIPGNESFFGQSPVFRVRCLPYQKAEIPIVGPDGDKETDFGTYRLPGASEFSFSFVKDDLLLSFKDSVSDASISDFLRERRLCPVGLLRDTGLLQAKILPQPSGDAGLRTFDLARELNGGMDDAALETEAFTPSDSRLDGASLNVMFPFSDVATEKFTPNGPVMSGFDPNSGRLGLGELQLSWPHFVMDTYSAHRLAEVSAGGVQKTGIAIVDTGLGSPLEPQSPDIVPVRIFNPTLVQGGVFRGIFFENGYRENVSLPDVQVSSAEAGSHGHRVAHFAVGDGNQTLGIAKDSDIRPIKLDKQVGEKTAFYRGAAGIRAAADDPNVDSINLSWGSTIDEGPLHIGRPINLITRFFGNIAYRKSIRKAIENGKFVVLAAGNHAIDVRLSSPQSLAPERNGEDPFDLMIVVGATTVDADLSGMEDLASFSNVGRKVSVSAPGSRLSTRDPLTQRIEPQSGTSFSSPYVAGLVAEMVGLDEKLRPGNAQLAGAMLRARNRRIKEIIEKTADPIEGVTSDQIGTGRINVRKALLAVVNNGVVEAGVEFPSINLPEFIVPPDQATWLGFNVRTDEKDAEVFLGLNQLRDLANQPATHPKGTTVSAYKNVRRGLPVPVRFPFPEMDFLATFSIKKDQLLGTTMDLRRPGEATPFYTLDISNLARLAVNNDDVTLGNGLNVEFDDYVFSVSVPVVEFSIVPIAPTESALLLSVCTREGASRPLNGVIATFSSALVPLVGPTVVSTVNGVVEVHFDPRVPGRIDVDLNIDSGKERLRLFKAVP